MRWILDDCVKFVKREIKRGAKYDGIIMDPPAFGHSPTGKTWKFNDDLPGLLNDCAQLLSDEAKFLIINGYATNSSALALNNLLEDAVKSKPGKIEFGELCLKQKSGRMISTGIFSTMVLIPSLNASPYSPGSKYPKTLLYKSSKVQTAFY